MRIYSKDIGMEIGIEKQALFIMKSGKQRLREEIELRNHEIIRRLEENENYKHLVILEVNTIKQVNKKEKKNHMKTRKLLEIKLSCRNLIKVIKYLAVPLVRCMRPFLKKKM